MQREFQYIHYFSTSVILAVIWTWVTLSSILQTTVVMSQKLVRFYQ